LPHGALDVLVCSASPPIRALGFHPDALDRLEAFVSRSVRLVAAPLTTFLPTLADRRGQVLVISSGALETLPAEWPHYVAAKSAVEGLTNWAAARQRSVRFTLARPPKLLTDQMNTPGGRAGALPVEGVAARLVAALADDGERTGSIRRLGEADLT
jgi:NAD(P)-dependent dehydrogenase (short-subunit alcohol dehydrogenase family)